MPEEPTPRRRWCQFTIMDLSLGIMLFAVGFGLLLATIRNHLRLSLETSEGLVAYIGFVYAAGALIGAGLLSPLRLKVLGMILGFVMIMPILFGLKIGF